MMAQKDSAMEKVPPSDTPQNTEPMNKWRREEPKPMITIPGTKRRVKTIESARTFIFWHIIGTRKAGMRLMPWIMVITSPLLKGRLYIDDTIFGIQVSTE